MSAELDERIVSAFREALDQNADVRIACINGTQRIGIWLRPFVSEQDNLARIRGLERLNILSAGETHTFFINSSLIRRKGLEEYEKMKRLNANGNPDPNGPIHLTGSPLSFEPPNRIITHVDGFDERPWPDVDFRLSITDTLSLSGGQVRCDTQRNLDVDTSWLDFLTGLSLFLLPPLGTFFLVERIIIGSKDAPDSAGAGGGVAAMIPQEILISGGRKVVAFYSRLEVFHGGIFAGGIFINFPRSPEVTIKGPSQISVQAGTVSLVRSYSLIIEDLRDPLQISWSGEGNVLNPTAKTAGFRFSPGSQAGQVVTRRVAVRVSDADNLVVSSELVVRIHVTPAGDDLPPVCRVKPWLPQCQEALARREQP